MNDKGFVKLPRCVAGKPWYDCDGTLRVYLKVLFNAAWKDFEYDGMTLHRGQYVTSIARLGEMCGLTVRQTRTALSHLKATKDIAVQTTAKFSIITLIDYDAVPPVDKPVDNLVDKHPDTVSDNRSRNEEKEIKENIKKEEVPPSFDSSNPSFSSSETNSSSVTRAELVGIYGSENVSVYERKLEVWKYRKSITGKFDDYGTIAKWMRQDNVQKGRSSSFDQEAVMCNLLHRYKKTVDNDEEK